MKKINKKKTPIGYTVPEYLHFLAVWTNFDILYFQIFGSKKRKSADQMKTFISDCSLCLSKM